MNRARTSTLLGKKRRCTVFDHIQRQRLLYNRLTPPHFLRVVWLSPSDHECCTKKKNEQKIYQMHWNNLEKPLNSEKCGKQIFARYSLVITNFGDIKRYSWLHTTNCETTNWRNNGKYCWYTNCIFSENYLLYYLFALPTGDMTCCQNESTPNTW